MTAVCPGILDLRDARDQVGAGLWIPDRAAVPALSQELSRMSADFEDWWVADKA